MHIESSFTNLTPAKVLEAQSRIGRHINRTAIIESERLSEWLGHSIIFKCDNFQKTGAFKARGALNTVMSLVERGDTPKKVVAFSSGNHAQAVAWSCNKFGIPATIYMEKTVSPIKVQATKSYGAEVVLTESRQQAMDICEEEVKSGAYFIPPYDNDMVIAGQGTCALETFQDGVEPDAVFVPLGGGGLVAGTFLASQLFNKKIKVFGCEPANGSDAYNSFMSGTIFKLDALPDTIADGVKTLSIAPRTFHFIRQLAGVTIHSEQEIIYFTQWIYHLCKIICEPSCSLSLAGAFSWLKEQTSPKTVLVILSGGNVSAETYNAIWKTSYLDKIPAL